MGRLKESVFDLSNKESDFKDFKTALINKINFKRESINLEYEDYEMNYGAIPDDAFTGVYEFPSALAVDIFSELGLATDKLDFKKATERIASNYYDNYSYINFSEVWEFIKELDEKSFLVAMLLLASSNSHWESITGIQQIIIQELNNFEFNIDYKRITVFIAMSFGKSMQKARRSIIKVIEEFGYEAILIDIKEHNNQIVPEIFSEIKNAEFVVSDLTEQKRGVYLEAGYAMALNKEVILSCKAEDFEKSHFDVSQINTIIWSDEGDLENRLRQRIKAMYTQRIV